MKKLIAGVLAAGVLMPAAAFAGSSTDAALGLGAFAVFNQVLAGVGIFQRYQAPPPPVIVAPPPPPPVVYPYPYYAPAPVYAYPAPVYVVPAPTYYAPPPVVIYRAKHWRHGDDDD
jgi:hypothetical protein